MKVSSKSIVHNLPAAFFKVLKYACLQFPRETYVPQFYSHRMDVVSCETGTVKCEGKKVTYDIGGCLCFQGDYLKKDLELYEAKQGA